MQKRLKRSGTRKPRDAPKISKAETRRAFGPVPAYMAYFETLEQRYPQVAFRSEATQTSLIAAAKNQASKKLRGPACSW